MSRRIFQQLNIYLLETQGKGRSIFLFSDMSLGCRRELGSLGQNDPNSYWLQLVAADWNGVNNNEMILRTCIDEYRLNLKREHYTKRKSAKSYFDYLYKNRQPLWSSGQSSWLQIRGPGSIPGTTRKKK
jgi:hypothetical protein